MRHHEYLSAKNEKLATLTKRRTYSARIEEWGDYRRHGVPTSLLIGEITCVDSGELLCVADPSDGILMEITQTVPVSKLLRAAIEAGGVDPEIGDWLQFSARSVKRTTTGEYVLSGFRDWEIDRSGLRLVPEPKSA